MTTIKTFLKNEGVQYFTEGKNVSSGWINIKCPFCNDRSNHLGIKLNNLNRCSCWKCGDKKLLDIVVEIKSCTIEEAKRITKDLISSNTLQHHKDIVHEEIKLAKKISLPKHCSNVFPKLHLDYLLGRNFNARKIIRKYSLKACYMDGEYKYRIIIPIYEHGKLICFTSRDVTNKQKLKYKTAPKGKSIVDPREVIYNIDSVNEYCDAALVEGPTDVWRFGDGAICFLGVNITPQRILKIGEKKIRNLFIIFDNDRTGKAKSTLTSKILSPVVKNIHVVKFKTKRINDIAEFSDDQIRLFKRSIDFKSR